MTDGVIHTPYGFADSAEEFIELLERAGHFKALEAYCEELAETQRRCGERLGHIIGSKGWCLNCGWSTY